MEDDLRQSLLHHAVLCSVLHAAEVLLQQNIDAAARDSHSNTALDLACARNDSGIINVIVQHLKRRCRPIILDHIFYTAMLTAVEHSNTEVLQLLIDYDASINLSNDKG